MQKIFNTFLATAMMLLSVSCSKKDNNPIEPINQGLLSMVLIPAGTFQMGNTGAYSGVSDELPVHTVIISKAFYMSKFEITQSQYYEVMQKKPSNFVGDNLPVEQVSWYDAVAFCNALSLKEGMIPCYTIYGSQISCNFASNGYRLPTEAEWEYACKSGKSTDFYNGNLLSKYNDINLNNIGWYTGNSNNTTHPVGQKQPNSFGLYDMNGNVWEWCWDWYGSYYNTAIPDPIGPSSGSYRIFRGGGWTSDAVYCRNSYRLNNYSPYSTEDFIGFRVVRLN